MPAIQSAFEGRPLDRWVRFAEERAHALADAAARPSAAHGTAGGSKATPHRPSLGVDLAILAGLAAGTALMLHAGAKAAERRHPPLGQFVEVAGVRLHYLAAGRGAPLVVLHGNGAMLQDFLTSPLYQRMTRHFRVFLFDRPGFGHSSRPRSGDFSPEGQARLFSLAIRKLGLHRPLVLGHSWGTLPALALGLDHPRAVGALLLASGYYYPKPRADIALMAMPAVPGLGDLLRYTVSPAYARLIWPRLIGKIFGPNPEPEAFRKGFPQAMALRPSQLRAAAAESATLLGNLGRLTDRAGDLEVPVVLVGGQRDQVVMTTEQSARLHAAIPGSRFRLLPGVGHMVHHAAPERMMAAIDEAAGLAAGRMPPGFERGGGRRDFHGEPDAAVDQRASGP